MALRFTLEVIDEQGRVSKVYGTLPAADVPATPAALTAEDVTGGYVSLSWTGTGGTYTIYRDGAPTGTSSSESYTDSAVVPSTAYSYQVQESNGSGSSALSDALAVTTSANSAPVWDLVDQSGVIGQAFSLNLTSVCSDDDAQALTFLVTSGSVPGVTLTGQTLAGTPTTAGASSLTITASDGYTSTPVTITFTVSDPDVTAPSIPTNVVASVNGSTVTVTWTASTDATGVATYRVYRGGVFRSLSTASPYAESGVPVGTYTYSVSAVDSSANANESAQGSASPVSVVPQTPDTPINFTATSDGATTINLSWAPGPNGTVPDDYDLDFSATSASGPWTAITFVGAATTYAHTGRTAGVTYYYRVRAGLGAAESGYAAATSSSVAYAFIDGFEATFIDPALYKQSTNPGTLPASGITLETSTTHSREGGRSLHTKVVKAGTTNYRSEVRVRSPTDSWMSAGSPDYWLGFSFYVPTGSDANQSRTIIAQFHTVAATGGGSPTLGIGMIDNTWYITRKGIGTVMELGAIPRNVWTDIVLRGRIRIDGTGEWDVWVNGALVWGVRNSNTHWTGEPNFPYLKLGRYAWDWDAATNTDPNGTYQETWHDAIRIATAAPGVDMYAAVAPRGNRLTAP